MENVLEMESANVTILTYRAMMGDVLKKKVVDMENMIVTANASAIRATQLTNMVNVQSLNVVTIRNVSTEYARVKSVTSISLNHITNASSLLVVEDVVEVEPECMVRFRSCLKSDIE